MNVKLCPRCLQTLSTDLFSRNRSNPDGCQSYCKACTKEYVPTSRHPRLDYGPDEKPCSKCSRILPRTQFYPKKTGLVSWCRECYQIHRPARYRKTTYGISEGGFQALWAEQAGRCAMCSGPLEDGKYHVDHDHGCCAGRKSCGSCVRGILCIGCNVALGQIERPGILALALEYIAQFERSKTAAVAA